MEKAAVFQLQKNYEEAREARKFAEKAETEAYRAWMTARVEYAAANPHKWAGKAVERATVKRVSYGIGHSAPRSSDRTVMERGTVTLATVETRGLRVYQPTPGEWFVLSASGLTGYRLDPSTLDPRFNKDVHETCGWDLES